MARMDTNSTLEWPESEQIQYIDHNVSSPLIILLVISIVVILVEARSLAQTHWAQRPGNVQITGFSTIFGHWLSSFAACIAVCDLVSNGYAKAQGSAFAIPLRRRYLVCLTSREQMQEYTRASAKDLSLRHAANDLFPPEILFNGLPISDTGTGSSQISSILQSRLRLKLPTLHCLLKERMIRGFDDQFASATKGWTACHVQASIKYILREMNAAFVVGPDLSLDRGFSDALKRYLGTATVTEELIQFVPTLFKSVIGNCLMHYNGSTSRVCRYLTKMIDELRSNIRYDGPAVYTDVAHGIARTFPKWSTQHMVSQVLSILFAADHQMPMTITFVLYNLCQYPEYLEPLRQEAAAFSLAGGRFQYSNDELPLLDSFVKETIRLSPLTSVAIPHKVITDIFAFSDGTRVPRGNWVGIPQEPLMRDPSYYTEPDTFNGFRFVNTERGGDPPQSTSRFSQPSMAFPFWGTVKQGCPGRFYASMVIKTFLTHLIANYDFRLADTKAPPTLDWGLARVPWPWLKMEVRPRASA